MDTLPPEILANIIDRLEGEVFKKEHSSYACISLAWQAAVERRTFRTIPVKLDTESLDYMCKVLLANNARRVHYIRKLKISPGPFPNDRDTLLKGPLRIDAAVWRALMARLFIAVGNVMGYVQNPQALCLKFGWSQYTSVIDWESEARDAPTSVPELRYVDTMVMPYPIDHVAEADLFALTDMLPSLTACTLAIRDEYDWGRRLRMERRKEQATALIARDFSRLHSLTLRGDHTDQNDEARDPSILTPDTVCGDDPSIRIMRHLTTLPQLTTLHLTGSHVINANFFQDLPPFPLLVDFQLDFAGVTADGRWFFVEDDALMSRIRELEEQRSLHYVDSDFEPVDFWDTDDEDGPIWQSRDWSNRFRTMPDPETISEFVVGATLMVSSCIHLQKFILRHRYASWTEDITWAHHELRPYGRNFEIWYLRSGARCEHADKRVSEDEAYVNLDRMYWRVGERWRPDADIVNAWRSAVGSDVKYCFLKDIYCHPGDNMAWDRPGGTRKEPQQYVLNLEWEEPGGTVDLELGELRQEYERNCSYFGPWPFEDRHMYDAHPYKKWWYECEDD